MERILVRETFVAPVGPAEALVQILDELKRSASGILGAAVADRNGLPIANAFREGVNLLTISAMSALAVQSCTSVMGNLGLRPLETVIMEGENSLVMVRVLSGGLSLLVMLEHDANVGLVRMEVERLAASIEEVLGL